jgi:hypothetical protein
MRRFLRFAVINYVGTCNSLPKREPIKNSEAGIAARNLRSQIRPHSATMELSWPPTHSQVPGVNPQTEETSPLLLLDMHRDDDELFMHLQDVG